MFLLNDQILDVGQEVETLRDEFLASRRPVSVYQAVRLGQQVMFAGGSFHDVHVTAARRVAAMIALCSEANAALFVRPPGAAAPELVQVRLAAAPLTTLARLEQFQHEGILTVALVNAHVWSLASGASAA
jgi:hypothetical protein